MVRGCHIIELYSHFKGPAHIVSLSLAIQSDMHFNAHVNHSDPLILKSFFLVAHPSARIFEQNQWRFSHETPEAIDLNTIWVEIGLAEVLTDPIWNGSHSIMILPKLYDKSIRALSRQNPPFGADLTWFVRLSTTADDRQQKGSRRIFISSVPCMMQGAFQ